MTDQTDNEAYHRRRAEQERRLAATATDPSTRHVHEQLERFHLERMSGFGGLKIVPPG